MSDQPAPQDHPDELARIKELAGRHGKTALTILAVLLVLIVGIRAYRAHRQSKTEEASAMFGSARSVEQLETLVNEYASAPSAPLSKLRLAKTYFDAGNFDGALATYREIKEQDVKGAAPVSDAAEVGIAASLEAKGQTEEALTRFDAFVTQNPGHFLTPQAVLGKARCLDKLYRTAEAKAIMEDYIAANPDTEWTGPAEDLLDRLNRKMEELNAQQ